MKSFVVQVLFGMSFLTAFWACDAVTVNKKSEGSASTVSVTLNEDEFRRDRDAYRAAAERRMADLDARMLDLQARAKKTTGEARVEMDKAIADQQGNIARARAEMKELEGASADKWEEFKRRSAAAIDDVQYGVERAWSQFK